MSALYKRFEATEIGRTNAETRVDMAIVLKSSGRGVVPSDAQVARVVAALNAGGFSNVKASSTHFLVDFSGPSRLAESFFGAELHDVNQQGAGVRRIAVKEPVLPTSLSDALEVVGLSSIAVARPLHVKGKGFRGAASAVHTVRSTSSAPAVIGGPTTNGNGYGPAAWANFYDFPSQSGSVNGAGQTVGISVGGNYLDSDIATYKSVFQVAQTGTTTRVLVDGNSGAFTGSVWDEEATLDLETIRGLAPGANIRVYLAPDFPSELNLLHTLNQAVANGVNVVSASYGGCYNSTTSAFEAVANQHPSITFAAATGDQQYSGFGCSGVGSDILPASADTWVAVGGTEPVNPAQGYNVNNEQWWNETPSRQGTYGQSGVFQMPPGAAWDGGLGPYGTGYRWWPDIALAAQPNNGAAIYFEGFSIEVGGTSLAAPIFSAMIAQVNQYRGGAMAYGPNTLYATEGTVGTSGGFRPINPFNSCCWNPNVGMGSMDGYAFAQSLVQYSP